MVAPGPILSYTNEEKPVNAADKRVTFGKYDLIKPFTQTEMKVHFENGKAFKHVSGPTRAPRGPADISG